MKSLTLPPHAERRGPAPLLMLWSKLINWGSPQGPLFQLEFNVRDCQRLNNKAIRKFMLMAQHLSSFPRMPRSKYIVKCRSRSAFRGIEWLVEGHDFFCRSLKEAFNRKVCFGFSDDNLIKFFARLTQEQVQFLKCQFATLLRYVDNLQCEQWDTWYQVDNRFLSRLAEFVDPQQYHNMSTEGGGKPVFTMYEELLGYSNRSEVNHVPGPRPFNPNATVLWDPNIDFFASVGFYGVALCIFVSLALYGFWTMVTSFQDKQEEIGSLYVHYQAAPPTEQTYDMSRRISETDRPILSRHYTSTLTRDKQRDQQQYE